MAQAPQFEDETEAIDPTFGEQFQRRSQTFLRRWAKPKEGCRDPLDALSTKQTGL
jgi:hypothetical protein